MMPKSNKTIKKGFDPPGNNYIALGSRTRDSSNPNLNSETQRSNTLNSANEANLAQSNISISSKSKIASNNSSSNFGSLSNSTYHLNTAVVGHDQYAVDAKNVKEEVVKLLENDDTTDKLIKFIESLVNNLKHPNISFSAASLKQYSQQSDLNFLMALSYIALKRPQFFLKNLNLVDFIVNNLLTSKNTSYDKTVAKNKQTQPIRSPSSPSQNVLFIQPVICNILAMVFENEYNWPEVFVTAFVYDSVGERCWVENPLCKDFVENVKTAFLTRAIPFSCENSNTQLMPNNSNSSIEFINAKSIESDSILEATEGFVDFTSKKSQIAPRYENIRSKIETTLVDLVKKILNAGNKGQAYKRAIGQSSIASTVNSDNKNIIKLLHNLCGVSELRKIASQKIEVWITNPKVDAYVQDLLLSICVNCRHGDQIDREIISNLIKIKPKPKHQQHFSDCFRELIKANAKNYETFIQLVVRNELFSQNQISQQAQNQQNKLNHNYFLLQTSFSNDPTVASKIFAQTLLKIILQKNSDQFLRPIKVLLRDTVRNCRQDFDLTSFINEIESDNLIKEYYVDSSEFQKFNSTNSIFSFAGGLADFSQAQIKERYLNSVSDLVAILILAAITPQIKEAYLRRSYESKEILTKYYLTMSKIQCDTVTWLRNIFKVYDVSPNELIRCLFKILFMVDKPEQCYTIDSWPSEAEKSTFFRVVSEIPVLSETLHQVLIITQNLPEHLYMLMLCAEENLLKTAALVHKDFYSIKLANMESFIEILFQICMYKYQDPPNLVVTVLYWKSWQILLLISALDPIEFGEKGWQKYPTLRLLMEMVMTEDYNFPPHCSINANMTYEKYKSMEATAIQLEKAEILEFENMFEAKQGISNKTEANSKLIGQVMKFDPFGPPRRPPAEAIMNIRKLNSEYKLGQLLCKSRNPDFLLMLINSQDSKTSLPWLASMIETSQECLEILPIHIVCELVWNLTSGTEEEIQPKRQWNVEILLNRLKLILTNCNLTNVDIIQQMIQILEYFFKKLESSKQQVRNGSLKILNCLLLSVNSTLDRGATTFVDIFQTNFDLNHMFNNFKQLITYENYIQPLLLDYCCRIILVETNPEYLNTYLFYLLAEMTNSYKQKNIDLNLLNGNARSSIDSCKKKLNQTSQYLSEFFFKRNYLKYVKNNADNWNKLGELSIELCKVLLKINEIEPQSHLIKQLQSFTRSNLKENYFLVVKSDQKFYYMNEQLFNLIIFIISLFGSIGLDDLMTQVQVLNAENFADVLNSKVSSKLLAIHFHDCQHLESNLVESLINSYSDNVLVQLLSNSYGLGTLSVYHILKKIEIALRNKHSSTLNQITSLSEKEAHVIKDHIDKTNNFFSELTLVNLIDEIKLKKIKCKKKKKKEFSFDKRDTNLIKQSTQNINAFNKILIKNKIHNYKNRNGCQNNLRQVENEIFDFKNSSQCLIQILNNSKIENLQTNIEKYFGFFQSNKSKIHILCDTISLIEKNDRIEKKYLLNILINYFCRFDPNVIDNEFNLQFKLIFEYRKSLLNFSILLSIFLHQANWEKLFGCFAKILENNNFFKHKIQHFCLNQSTVLEFLNSLIHLPTFSKVDKIALSQPKCCMISFLNLTEDQFAQLIDILIEEMFIVYLSSPDQNDISSDFKSYLDNRIELLDHILRSQNVQFKTIYKLIACRLKLQKKIFSSCQNERLIDYLRQILNDNSTCLDLSSAEIFEYSKNILQKVQTFFLYRVYLNHNSLIYELVNSNRLFCNMYQLFDKPTELDLKTHNLLNCFGEIEVNFSYNLTSSGIIGVAVTSGPSKQKSENQEMVQLAKKQEEFMVDANFVCIKLASSHPFIFIRQLPMMEGMLQGRVGYSFEEFKKRKFDKLFHYIIDILNILVPFVFHLKYREYVKAIVSHYFDVFLSYCEENREFIGSLVIKFCEFLERFVNTDLESGYFEIIKKYCNIIGLLQKSYPEISSLKFLSSIQSVQFESASKLQKTGFRHNIFYSIYQTQPKHVNSLLQKFNMPLWKTKQLEPFINKLSNRSNYEEVLFVLNELDTVSERQPIILSQFAIYLKSLLEDNDDKIRDYAFSLLMRYLRLNPNEAKHFYKSYKDCLISEKNKIYNSAIKFLSDFILLSSDKSEILIREAIRGSQKHNIDISGKLYESIRLLRLEKYVY